MRRCQTRPALKNGGIRMRRRRQDGEHSSRFYQMTPRNCAISGSASRWPSRALWPAEKHSDRTDRGEARGRAGPEGRSRVDASAGCAKPSVGIRRSGDRERGASPFGLTYSPTRTALMNTSFGESRTNWAVSATGTPLQPSTETADREISFRPPPLDGGRGRVPRGVASGRRWRPPSQGPCLPAADQKMRSHSNRGLPEAQQYRRGSAGRARRRELCDRLV